MKLQCNSRIWKSSTLTMNQSGFAQSGKIFKRELSSKDFCFEDLLRCSSMNLAIAFSKDLQEDHSWLELHLSLPFIPPLRKKNSSSYALSLGMPMERYFLDLAHNNINLAQQSFTERSTQEIETDFCQMSLANTALCQSHCRCAARSQLMRTPSGGRSARKCGSSLCGW